MNQRQTPNIYSIPLGVPFLPTFLESFFSGKLIEGVSKKSLEFITISDINFYVPTRRSARALREEFIKQSGCNISFLPKVFSLSDLDETRQFFWSLGSDNRIKGLSPIATEERLLELGQLIYFWYQKIPDYLKSYLKTEINWMPTRMSDAIWFARDLSALIDQIENYDIDWLQFSEIDFGFQTKWWELTWEFLTIVRVHWPKMLQERKKCNPIFWQNYLLKKEKKLLSTTDKIVVAAGFSIGSMELYRFLKMVSIHPRGAVVLNGVDPFLDSKSLQLLNNENLEDLSLFSHPQKGLCDLLKKLETPYDSLKILSKKFNKNFEKGTFISEIFRPARCSYKWQKLSRVGAEKAFQNITLIEANNEHEESLSIAIALREAIDDLSKTAALVCTDRVLARRVCAQLRRFEIIADDSGGIPLRETQQGRLLTILVHLCFKEYDPAVLLSLLQHPFVHMGYSRVKYRILINAFETHVLRNELGCNNWMDIKKLVQEKLQVSKNRGFTKQSYDFAKKIFFELDKILAPLFELYQGRKNISIKQLSYTTLKILEELVKDDSKNFSVLYAKESGECFRQFFESLLNLQSPFLLNVKEWPDLLTVLSVDVRVKPRSGGHPRLFIWDPDDARLQNVDTVVIAGLHENNWPPKVKNGPFLSRFMKMAIGLPPPEHKTGILAHDLQVLLGMERVFLTRSISVKNEISISSRWWQRLELVAGENISQKLRLKGDVYCQWARLLDKESQKPHLERPNPTPPLHARPTHFSVTEIETLRQNPYAIYCKKILRLKPLPVLIKKYGPREQGRLLHKIIEYSSQEKIKKSDYSFQDFLKNAHSLILSSAIPKNIEWLWWQNFKKIAPFFWEWDSSRAIKKSYVEISSRKIAIEETKVTLSGIADRIDLLDNGAIELIDFKLSGKSLLTAVESLKKPQLLLEAFLLENHAFDIEPFNKISDLMYVVLEIKNQKLNIISLSEKDIPTLQAAAMEQLKKLLKSYELEDTGYISYAMLNSKNFVNDYDHLSRRVSWEQKGTKE